MYESFGNLLTAMVTPFDENQEVDYEKVKELSNKLVEEGNDGLVVLGTTGEVPTLSSEEKLETAKELVLYEYGELSDEVLDSMPKQIKNLYYAIKKAEGGEFNYHG